MYMCMCCIFSRTESLPLRVQNTYCRFIDWRTRVCVFVESIVLIVVTPQVTATLSDACKSIQSPVVVQALLAPFQLEKDMADIVSRENAPNVHLSFRKIAELALMTDPMQAAAHAAQQEKEQQERELEVFDEINKQYASQDSLALVGSEDSTSTGSSSSTSTRTSSSSSSSSAPSDAVASPSKRKRTATHDSA